MFWIEVATNGACGGCGVDTKEASVYKGYKQD